MRILSSILTGTIAAGWASGALADAGSGDWSGHPHMMGWGGWFMGPLMMLIFLAVLVGAVVLVVRLLDGGTGGRGDQRADRSLEILRERFAKGEIDAEEFEARKKALGD